MNWELVRETLEKPQLSLVPHVGYVSLFPFMMGIIPSVSTELYCLVMLHWSGLFYFLQYVLLSINV